MIAITGRKCGSLNVRKNGRTRTDQQKFHCKDGTAYGTRNTKEHERHLRRETVERVHVERLSQRAIARTTGMRRTTIAGRVKKSLDTDARNQYAAP